ncbi:acyl-CoA dehydrogenase family protein [Cognatiluteimonas telluris]|jgi:alkylation response protein AidB-like acyl-CoA dehydrogenase|uniref:acyl-CoA dehydrogenase family protein n=1 Tax=Cognatiluteimonas telluris TaxID=1104775 RepID=UPI0014083787|nr:acyl-CoA dehydrogenase family protein [Lysobacter telluris]
MSAAVDLLERATQVARLKSMISVAIAARADDFDAAGELPADVLSLCAQEGLFGMAIPTGHGGIGLDPRELGEVFESLGRASASALSLATVHVMVCSALLRWGSAAQKQRWLPHLASGGAIGAFALSEAEAGSDANAVQTTLRSESDEIVVDGCKAWISFGTIAGLFLVVGKLDGRIAAILVDRSTPGIDIEPIDGMAGFRAGMLAQVRFEGCRVPRENLLGSADFGLSQIVGSVLDHGRYSIAWGAVGLAQACLQASVDYAAKRRQFGRPLQEHQLVQQMLADMMVEHRAARLMCLDAAAARANRSPDMIVRTTAAKYVAARAADRAAAAAMQIHGANGFSTRYPVQRFQRDARVFGVIEGTTQIQQVLLAQHAPQWADGLKEFF